jgi:hypothetical protein
MRLTRAEIILLTSLFLALAVGSVVKHCREARRLTLPHVDPSPKPGPPGPPGARGPAPPPPKDSPPN